MGALWLYGAILAMMVLLALLKRETRRRGLHRLTAKAALRKDPAPVERARPEATADAQRPV